MKVLADKTTDRVLGVAHHRRRGRHLIAEAAWPWSSRASAEDIGRACHAHPTRHEAIKEAALAAWDKPIHL